MDLGLEDRVALVTGASKGLGKGIAAALAHEGARVAISSRSRERIETAAAEIGALGLVHDSADLDAAPELVESVESQLGPIEVLVANTGGPPPGPDPLGFTREQWEAAYRELVLAPMALVERVVHGMRERGFGRILSVGSSAIREPIASLMLSNSHRAALLGALKTLSREVARDGVTVNTLLPGVIAGSDRADVGLHRGRRGVRPLTGPSRPPRDGGGVRRGGGVPLLGARVVRDRHDGAGRRRRESVGLT